MKRTILVLSIIFAVPATAQTPRSSQTAFAAALAENLSTAYAQIDQLNGRIAELTKELAEAKKTTPTTPPKP